MEWVGLWWHDCLLMTLWLVEGTRKLQRVVDEFYSQSEKEVKSECWKE